MAWCAARSGNPGTLGHAAPPNEAPPLGAAHQAAPDAIQRARNALPRAQTPHFHSAALKWHPKRRFRGHSAALKVTCARHEAALGTFGGAESDLVRGTKSRGGAGCYAAGRHDLVRGTTFALSAAQEWPVSVSGGSESGDASHSELGSDPRSPRAGEELAHAQAIRSSGDPFKGTYIRTSPGAPENRPMAGQGPSLQMRPAQVSERRSLPGPRAGGMPRRETRGPPRRSIKRWISKGTRSKEIAPQGDTKSRGVVESRNPHEPRARPGGPRSPAERRGRAPGSTDLSRNSPKQLPAASAGDTQGRPMPPAAAAEDPKGRPMPPAAAAEDPEGRPMPPAAAAEDPEGRPTPPAAAAEDPEGRPTPPAAAAEDPEGRPMPPAAAAEDPEGRPTPPAAAAEDPKGRPMPPAAAAEDPEGRPMPPAGAAEDPKGRPMPPAAAAEDPEGRPTPPAAAAEDSE
eukprot:gene16592-biopygen772